MTFRSSVVAIASMCLGSLALPGVASAGPALGSSSTLSSLIVANPEPGWTEAPASAVSEVTERLQKVDSNALSSGSVTVAANLWLHPDSAGFLAITLTEWPTNFGDYSQAIREGFNDECVSVTGNNPDAIVSAPGLPGSLSALCTSTDGSTQLAATMARKGDIIEMVESVGANGSAPLDPSTVDGIAVTQYGLLPAPPGPSAVQMAIGVVVLLGLVVSAAVLLRRRRSGRKPRIVFDVAYTPGSPDANRPTTFPPPIGSTPRPVSIYVPHGSPVISVQPESGPQRQSDLPTLDEFFSEPQVQAVDALSEQTTMALPSPPPEAPAVQPRSVGWHPDGDNPYVQRYWTGTDWVGRASWDGTQWQALDGVAFLTSSDGTRATRS